MRAAITERWKRMAPEFWPSLIHRNAINAGANTGIGCVLQAGSIIMPNVSIGTFTYINLGVTVGHATRIGDYCVVNPLAAISGGVTIGARVLVGTGACIRQGVTIGDDATVGMGAVVVKDVPAGATVVGNPARPIVRSGGKS